MTTRRVWLCFEAHAKDRKVWGIRWGNQWHRAEFVECTVPMETIYRGAKSKQPKAYLAGTAQRLTFTGQTARIA